MASTLVMNHMPTDLQRAVRGDRDALRRVLDAHWPQMRGQIHIVQVQSLETVADALRSVGCLRHYEDDSSGVHELELIGYVDEE